MEIVCIALFGEPSVGSGLYWSVTSSYVPITLCRQVQDDSEKKGPSKSELKKQAKEAEKERKRQEREAKEAAAKAAKEAADVVRNFQCIPVVLEYV